MEIRSLRPEELDAWFDHCMYIFGGGNYSADWRRYFQNHWENDPWRNLEDILVAVDGAEIASTVRIFHRRLFLFGEEVPTGGIGEVSTKPAYRGQGLASALLAAAIRRMEERGMRLSLLSAGIQDFYARLGWRVVPRRWRRTALPEAGGDGTGFRRMDPALDLPALRSLHAAYSGRLNGPIVRDDEFYWSHWFRTEVKSCWVAEEKPGAPHAYLCATAKEGRVRVTEFGAAPGREEALDPLAVRAARELDPAAREISIPAVVPVHQPPTGEEEDRDQMIRLVLPGRLGGVEFRDTDALVAEIARRAAHDPGAGFVFWAIDSY